MRELPDECPLKEFCLLAEVKDVFARMEPDTLMDYGALIVQHLKMTGEDRQRCSETNGMLCPTTEIELELLYAVRAIRFLKDSLSESEQL